MKNKAKVLILVCILFLATNLVGQDLPIVKPESVGMSSERLERIGTVVQRSIDDKRIAGAVTLVARRGQVVWFKAQGVMDITTNTPMHRDAIFRIASMTKPLVTVAMMILYEEGKFQLDDPVSKFIPELKGQKVFSDGDRETWAAPKREMTIQDLLRHTSGLTYGNYPPVTGIDKMLDAAKLDDSPTLKDMVLKLCGLPLLFSPGERWEYGWSTDVLGYVVQIISKKPIDVFLRERIFEPLRMADTDFFVPKEKWSRFTSLHAQSERGDLVVTDTPVNGKWSRKPTLLEPGAGLVSTAADYFRFTQMLLNRGELEGARLLSPKTVDLMTVNQLPAQAMPLSANIPANGWMVNGWGFGMGFRVLMDPVAAGSAASLGSYGWFGFRNTFFLIDPKEQLIGIFMAQFTPPPLYPGVREFQTLMFQAIVR